MEEYERDWCIHGCHVYHETWEVATGDVTPWWQLYLPISARIVILYPRMAHWMRYGWLLPLLDLLQQLPRMVLRMTTNLLNQEDCYGIFVVEIHQACPTVGPLDRCQQMRMSPQLKRHVSTQQHSGESQCTEIRHLPVQLALPSLGTPPHYHIPYTIPFVSFVCAVSHRTHRNVLPAW